MKNNIYKAEFNQKLKLRAQLHSDSLILAIETVL